MKFDVKSEEGVVRGGVKAEDCVKGCQRQRRGLQRLAAHVTSTYQKGFAVSSVKECLSCFNIIKKSYQTRYFDLHGTY